MRSHWQVLLPNTVLATFQSFPGFRALVLRVQPQVAVALDGLRIPVLCFG
jgi:hypothetical protein